MKKRFLAIIIGCVFYLIGAGISHADSFDLTSIYLYGWTASDEVNASTATSIIFEGYTGAYSPAAVPTSTYIADLRSPDRTMEYFEINMNGIDFLKITGQTENANSMAFFLIDDMVINGGTLLNFDDLGIERVPDGYGYLQWGNAGTWQYNYEITGVMAFNESYHNHLLPQSGSRFISNQNGDSILIGDYSPVNTPEPEAPVPEPATMLLLGTGIAGLLGARLRLKKTVKH